MEQQRPRMGPVPPALQAAVERVAQSRGDVREFHKVFDHSLVPMILVDNDRRYLAINMASQLMARIPESELRGRRIDDFTPAAFQSALQDAFARLMRDGVVTGQFVGELPDGSSLSMHYAGICNFLPGRHLVVMIPAKWPEVDLPALPDDVRRAAPLELSPRQREVIGLVARGYDVAQMADELSLSRATVRTHVRDAMRRLGANNRAHAVAVAIAAGLISYR
jgi:DNA-binding CsgD family transcriptional regulator